MSGVARQALSPVVGGWISQVSNYNTAFGVPGSLVVGSLVLWIAGRAIVREVDSTSLDP